MYPLLLVYDGKVTEFRIDYRREG